MRKILISLIILITLPFSVQAQNKVGIAAIVNDTIITTSDVMGRINLGLQGSNLKPDPKIMKEFEKQALEALIDEEIRLSEARRLGITPTEEEVNESFVNLAKQNGRTPEEFKKILQRFDGVHSSLIHQLKTQIAWNNVIRRKIRPQIKVSEDDIDANIAEQNKSPAKIEYQIAEIFLRNTEANKKLADQLVKELRSGKQRFSVVAKQFSQGLEASKGGLIGWVRQGALEEQLNSAISITQIGQITDVITTLRGLHILLIRERRDVLPLDQSSLRLNLKQITLPVPIQAPQEYKNQALAFARELTVTTKDCKAMDKAISKMNNPASKDLGEVRLGDLSPAVIREVKSLQVNQITQPIITGDAILLFMVCGRNSAVEETIRNDIANQIGTERLNRMQQRYYRDLRSAAYVDIK